MSCSEIKFESVSVKNLVPHVFNGNPNVMKEKKVTWVHTYCLMRENECRRNWSMNSRNSRLIVKHDYIFTFSIGNPACGRTNFFVGQIALLYTFLRYSAIMKSLVSPCFQICMADTVNTFHFISTHRFIAILWVYGVFFRETVIDVEAQASVVM